MGLAPDNIVSCDDADWENREPLAGAQLELYAHLDYVVHQGNERAFEIGMEIARNPHAHGNPVMFIGTICTGKSRLLSVIHDQARLINPAVRCTRITSADFIVGYSDARNWLELDAFVTNLADNDLLLVDDIEGIVRLDQVTASANNLAPDEAFTAPAIRHTFAELCGRVFQKGGRVVMAVCVDASADDFLADFAKRVGVPILSECAIELKPPCCEARRQIVDKLIVRENLKLSKEARVILAGNSAGDIRRIEGLICKIKAEQSLCRSLRKNLTTEYVRSLIGEIGSDPGFQPSIQQITAKVADGFKIRARDLIGPRRNRSFTKPRFVAMYLIHRIRGASHENIGDYFGDRDPTTVRHAIKEVESWMTSDAIISNRISAIRAELTDRTARVQS
jgi:chromosomal replication initiator protein